MSRSLKMLISGFTVAGFAFGAQAQEQPSNPAPAPQAEMQAPVTDADLKAFADTQEDIREIREGFQADREAAKDDAEIKALQTDAQSELDTVIAESPLSMDKLNQIAALIQQDPTVQKRYVEIVQQ